MGELIVRPCTMQAAVHAVRRWHYSDNPPSGKLVRYGVWEGDRFTGAVIFGRGATHTLGRPYGLGQTESCELVRVALRDHEHPVTQIVARALKLLRRDAPGMRLVISFADPLHHHLGVIYQAGNWIYTGRTPVTREWLLHDRIVHERSVSSMLRSHPRWRPGLPRGEFLRSHVDPDARPVDKPGKHRYLMPLDRALRRKLRSLHQPYPRAVEGSEASHVASGDEVQVRSLPTAR